MSDAEREKLLAAELVKRDVISKEELERVKERERESGTPWYRQLLQLQKIPLSLVDDVLRREFHPKAKRAEHMALGDMLVEMKILTQAQLNEALAEQKRNGRLLGRIIQERGWVDQRMIDQALSRQYGLEFADVSKTPSDPRALDAVPESVARRNAMIPVRIEGDKLTVLIANPMDRNALENVGVILGKRIYAVLTSCTDVKEEIARRYKKQEMAAPAPKTEEKATDKPAKKASDGKKTEASAPSRKEKDVKTVQQPNQPTAAERDKSRFESIAQQASGVPVVKLVSTIIEGAVNSGATDIHLDPQEPEMRVRYRIDGVLHDVMSIPPEIENAVISRIKILSDLDITETRHPQDGHISTSINDTEYDIRVASLPTFLGERVVLRLLDQTSVLAGIRDLGLEPDDEAKLSEVIKQPYGMVLVTGPTGSGKTTTLYAALNQKNVMTESIVTLEDPVEYQLSGINQVQIDADIGVTFAEVLRASMRQDIDVLLVGEIRDPETARIAIRAAMTGHLVLSTLHTNDAPEAISTLRNMSVPSYLISSALTAVIAQRLVRKICPHCKAPFTPTKTMLKSVGLPESVKKLYRGKGCDNCYHTGNKGRTGIFEIIEITPEIRKMVANDDPIDKITKAAKLKTMAERCRLKMKRGEVAPEEFLRVIRT